MEVLLAPEQEVRLNVLALATGRQKEDLVHEAVSQMLARDVETYRQLLDMAAEADALEGIRQGREDARLGRMMEAITFFEEFELRHGIPR